MKTIDCRSKPCPQPVIDTQKYLKENQFPFKVIVDNIDAQENIVRLLEKSSCHTQIIAKQGQFEIVVNKGENNLGNNDKTETSKGLCYIIGSDKLGNGPIELGDLLLRNFFVSLLESTPLPKKILLLNSAVKLACSNSQVIPVLTEMMDKGTKIASCGLCLDYFNIKEELKVGEVTNMYEIVTALNEKGVYLS